MSIYIKGVEMPPTGNYFAMVENKPGSDPNITIWKRKPDGSLEHFAFGHIIDVPLHDDLVDVRTAYDKIAEQETSYYMDMDGVDSGLQSTPVIIPADEEVD